MSSPNLFPVSTSTTGSGVLHPSQGIQLFDHFLSGGGSVNTGNIGWVTQAASGQVSASATGPDGTHVGVAAFSTLANAASFPTLYAAAGGGFCVGLGSSVAYEYLVQFPVLSVLGEEYSMRGGLFNVISTANPGNGAYFDYNRVASGNFFRTVSYNATATTMNVTSVPVVAGQWYKLKVIINTAGTQIDYYIDDVLVQSHTTNIPTGTAKPINPVHQIIKSSGTTPRLMLLDWVYIYSLYGV